MANYNLEKSINYVNNMREITKAFPKFIQEYFMSLTTTTEASTRYNYAVDIRTFLMYLTTNPLLEVGHMEQITEEIFGSVKATDIYEYLDYLTAYNGKTNTECGFARKLTAIRNLYNYFLLIEHPVIRYNPALAVKMVKPKKKDIVYLDEEEINTFLNYVQHPTNLTKREQDFFIKTQKRDYAIIMLFLGTGMRLSELAGLNLDNINFHNNSCMVRRKGGKIQNLYFNTSTQTALSEYIHFERSLLVDPQDKSLPLFISLQKNRMSERSIQNMVMKYVRSAIPYKHITVHKLRASYATYLYSKSNDIFMVADTLGHESLNTTKRYTNIAEQHRMSARDFIGY